MQETKPKKDATQTFSLRITKDEAQLLNDLRKKIGARTSSQAVRKSITQTSALADMADPDGFLTIIDKNGREIRVPVGW